MRGRPSAASNIEDYVNFVPLVVGAEVMRRSRRQQKDADSLDRDLLAVHRTSKPHARSASHASAMKRR